MPIFNLYKNCSYYWTFGAYISWFINHPLYTSPPLERAIILFTLAMTAELSNFKCADKQPPPPPPPPPPAPPNDGCMPHQKVMPPIVTAGCYHCLNPSSDDDDDDSYWPMHTYQFL